MSTLTRNEIIDKRFRRLASEWQASVGPSSSAAQMSMHPAYQQIIGMGSPVIPYLLRALEESPDHWFWALRAVTGEDPVPVAVRGRVNLMAQAWLKWGHEHGHLSQKNS